MKNDGFWLNGVWVEIGDPPREEPPQEAPPESPPDKRMDEIEAALIELAGLVAGGE